jgi:ElaB/YqjD/DUF883 family membrane-anchored ribosome-binding protein
MSTHHDDDRKIEKVKAHYTKAEKEVISDINDIKENVVGLARNLKDVSATKANDAADYVRDRVDTLKETGLDRLEKVEARIQAKPGQSIAIAFAAGLIANFLLGRKKA